MNQSLCFDYLCRGNQELVLNYFSYYTILPYECNLAVSSSWELQYLGDNLDEMEMKLGHEEKNMTFILLFLNNYYQWLKRMTYIREQM